MSGNPNDNLPRPASTSARRRPTQALRPEPEHKLNKEPPQDGDPIVAPWEETNAAKISARRATARVEKQAQEKATQSFGKMPTREVPKPGSKPVTKPITKPIPQSPPKPIAELEPQIRQAIADFKANMSSYDVRQKLLYGGVAESQVLEVIAIARERAGLAPATGNTQYIQKAGPVPFNSAATATPAPAAEANAAAPAAPSSPWLAVGIGGAVAVLGLVCLALVLKAASDPGASLNIGLLAIAVLMLIIGGGIVLTAMQSRDKS